MKTWHITEAGNSRLLSVRVRPVDNGFPHRPVSEWWRRPTRWTGWARWHRCCWKTEMWRRRLGRPPSSSAGMEPEPEPEVELELEEALRSHWRLTGSFGLSEAERRCWALLETAQPVPLWVSPGERDLTGSFRVLSEVEKSESEMWSWTVNLPCFLCVLCESFGFRRVTGDEIFGVLLTRVPSNDTNLD